MKNVRNSSGGSSEKRHAKDKRINIMCSALDKAIADFRDKKDSYKEAVISINQLAGYTPVHERTFRGWNPQNILVRKYDSVEYKRYTGFIVEWEKFIEERKEERKNKSDSNGN